MKMKQMLSMVLAALLIFTDALPASAEEAPGMLVETIAIDETDDVSDHVAVTDNQEPDVSRDVASPKDKPLDMLEDMVPADDESIVPEEPPMFSAHVEYSFQGYLVRGTFTEFTSDIALIQPMYSLDGESYLPCGECWDLCLYGSQENGTLEKLQNQICLYSSHEPLKSYLGGELDFFYLKLCITKENGISYETQAAIIDRGDPQPLPEEISVSAVFGCSVRVRETNPFRCYGRYQLTVSEDATPEEIAAYLPDTLPIEVQLQNGNNAFTTCIVNCPITWKPLSLSSLTPGECVTIADAAEAVAIPAGTLLHTPLGIFELDETLGIDQPGLSDEINLVLNVVTRDEAPSGALTEERDGLELAFHLKPTGATAIRAYICLDGDTQWIPLPDLPFLSAVDAQPSTKNSGYTLVLDNAVEPYCSYLTQEDNGNPTPFFVGLKIEGGTYDGKQLILAWPGSYDPPHSLPELGGSGGNEDNAGSDNKNDSTTEGQRPNLPQDPDYPPRKQNLPHKNPARKQSRKHKNHRKSLT